MTDVDALLNELIARPDLGRHRPMLESLLDTRMWAGQEYDDDDVMSELQAQGITPHIITPHKGGRTESVHLRFTPLELATLDEARGKMSRSDFIMKLLKADDDDE